MAIDFSKLESDIKDIYSNDNKYEIEDVAREMATAYENSILDGAESTAQNPVLKYNKAPLISV